MTTYEYKRVPVPPNADGFLEVGLADWLNLHGDEGWELVQIQEFDDAAHPVATFKRAKVVTIVTQSKGPIGATERDQLLREIDSARKVIDDSLRPIPAPRKPEPCLR